MASGSRGLEQAGQLVRRLAPLDPLGEHAQRERLHPGDRPLAGRTVGKHARERRDLGDPVVVRDNLRDTSKKGHYGCRSRYG